MSNENIGRGLRKAIFYGVTDSDGEHLTMTRGYVEFLNGRAQLHLQSKGRMNTPLWKGAIKWLQRDVDNHQHKIRRAYDGWTAADQEQDIMEHAPIVQSAMTRIHNSRWLENVLRSLRLTA